MPTPEPVSPIPHGICQAGCQRLSAYLRNKFSLGDSGCYNPGSKLPSGAPSYHVDGQAIDLTANANANDQRSRADACFAWVVQHAEELNLQEMIWHDKIITARRWSEGIRHYSGGDHDNHVHIAIGRDASRNWRPQGTREPEPVVLVDEAASMGQPNRFITASTNTPWFFFNGVTIYEVSQADAQLLIDLNLVHKADPAKKEKQVAVIGAPALDGLLKAHGPK